MRLREVKFALRRFLWRYSERYQLAHVSALRKGDDFLGRHRDPELRGLTYSQMLDKVCWPRWAWEDQQRKTRRALRYVPVQVTAIVAAAMPPSPMETLASRAIRGENVEREIRELAGNTIKHQPKHGKPASRR